ncbi:MAG: DUF4292 domain-containing protein [Prevotellaceae bacterium]|jgi:hypothetical protein|nr:DUF4292 domain-containing protein [Prevotellaceae bacterium]
MKKNILLIIILTVALVGCKTRQKTQQPKQISQTEILSAENIVNQVLNQQNDISFVNIPNAEASLDYNGRKFAVKFVIKVVADKQILISVLPFLGIEMFKVELTPKKFFIYDKLYRQYCENSYDYLSQMFGTELSYSTVEALLLNRLFTIDNSSKNALKRAFSSMQLTDKYVLTANKKTNNLEHRFEISPDFKISGTFLNQNTLDVVSLQYSDFDIKNGVLFPMTYDAKVVSATKNLNVNFTIKKIEINKEFEISATDISRYQKVDCGKMF